MPIHNDEIVRIFDETADLLELRGENLFRIRAYRRAAQTIASMSKSVAEFIAGGGDLTELSGIGKDLSLKIREIIETGKLTLLDELRRKLPAGLSHLMSISGLGPKRVKTLYDKLGIRNIDELKKAAEKGKIAKLPGFGKKSEKNILEGISQAKKHAGRIKLIIAEEIIRPLIDYLKKEKEIKDIEVAGSTRRKQETVKDADILVTCKKGSQIMDRFVKYEDVKKIISKGNTRSSVLLRSDFQVDLRVVSESSYGAALLYFTGSKAHNIAIRKIAVEKDLKINEYGIFSIKGNKDIRLAGKTEEEVYKKIGLPYFEPELREDRGEIEAAKKGALPGLITIDNIKGDLHIHTNVTDGRCTLEEMAGAAKGLGYEYIADTEHSRHVTVARGLDEKKLAAQIKKVDKLNKKLKGIVVLKSIELDILENGSLDLKDSILKELDLVVCAIHYKFNLPAQKQTERILRAIDNPYFNILAHPTGRMIGERPAYELDMEKVMKAAKERGCILELNAHPERLDLNDIHCKAAKEIGVKIVISTDAHSTDDLSLLRFGIYQARRGWLEAKDVVNTLSLEKLKEALKRK